MCFSLANICGGWRVINEMATIYNEHTNNGRITDLSLVRVKIFY
jgi:hypothetical protein